MSIFCTACSHANDEADGLYCEQCGKELPIPPALLATGTLLASRYEILGKISEGGMGCIFKARDTRLNTIVAIKQMQLYSINPADLPYFEKRFREEAQILSNLHHSGIPKVTDFFTIQDAQTKAQVHYLVMTFIEGKSLASVIADRGGRPFTVDEALTRFRQMLDILKYIHDQKPPVIHRDLNPRNIMIDGDRVFLVDFGLARIFTPQRTNTTQPMGTAGYAPPEQVKGCADHRSDIYSLGVVMHYLLTGADPEDPAKKLFIFQPPSDLNSTVPLYLSDLIMAMVSIDPDTRPASVAEVLARLSAPPSQKPSQPHPAPSAAPATRPITVAPAASSSHTPPAIPLPSAPTAHPAPRPIASRPVQAPIPVQRKASQGHDPALIAVVAGVAICLIFAACSAFLIGLFFTGNRPSPPAYAPSPIESSTLYIHLPTAAPEPAGEAGPAMLTPLSTAAPLSTPPNPPPLSTAQDPERSPTGVTPAVMTPAYQYTQKQPGEEPPPAPEVTEPLPQRTEAHRPAPSIPKPIPQPTGVMDDPGVPGTIDGQGTPGSTDTKDPGIPGEIY